MAFSWFLSSILLGIKQVFPKDEPQPGSKSHDWPWSSIVWLLFGSSFVSSFFLGWTFSKSLSPFLYYSFCLFLCSILLASSPWFIWCFFGISIGFPSQFYEFLWCFYDFLWDFKGCPWKFKGIPVGFQKSISRVSIGFLGDLSGNPIGFPWYFSWISMVFPWDFSRISVVFKDDFYGISVGFLLDLHEASWLYTSRCCACV